MFRRINRRWQGRRPAVSDIMAGPVNWKQDGRLGEVAIKVDRAHAIGGAVIVAGWSSGDAPIGLCNGGVQVETTCFRTEREDVARYLGLSSANDLGFVLLAMQAPASGLELCCGAPGSASFASFPLQVAVTPPGRDAIVQFAPAIERLRGIGIEFTVQEGVADAQGDSGQWGTGAIDDARASPDARMAVVSGWFVGYPGSQAWIETSDGRRFPLTDGHRADRPDVRTTLSAELSGYGERAGYLLLIDDVAPGERLRLVAGHGEREHSLASVVCTSWGGDPVAAARWLFSYPTPLGELAGRIPTLDMPILGAMIEARHREWRDLPVRREQVGPGPEAPRASIIVPLYGRFDFVEHQLLEFARDPWLLANAELVYVVDDRELVGRMASEAWNLQRLYGVPFSWVWGGVNRGFAGANNLGVAHSRGRQLVFLNSDAIPLTPGWLEPMLRALDIDPGIGALGPRLLFGDGSIQHAGMAFRRRPDLGIWTNHHPNMGLDPRLDPNDGPADVPSVTGACLAMQRDVFDRIGGWDTGYLIGDFEDSDLCLKLREAGLRTVYLPGVELTHLERQSFKLLGEGDFRTRVVVWNAVRHQQRWARQIAVLAAAPTEARA